jgi:tRNA (mo5U34)-methyltransferase
VSESSPFEYVRRWQAELDKTGWWHSFELPDGTCIHGDNPLEGLKDRLAQFPIAEDLNGKRVLDIGTWDGWFAFEMERRGAEVIAIDVWDNPRFHQMHSMLNSTVEYRMMDVYDLSPSNVGRFDVVLFLGVLYHLKHPMLALERVCSVTTDLAAIDSFVLQERHRKRSGVQTRPFMEFYESDEFGGQTDNWVGPTLPCLMAFCRTAGFARVGLRKIFPDSACVACFREWEPTVDRRVPAARLTHVAHNTRHGVNFSSERDDYVSCWFDWEEGPLTRHDVQPEVGGWGTIPIYVGRVGPSEWQANFKLPPGLPPATPGGSRSMSRCPTCPSPSEPSATAPLMAMGSSGSPPERCSRWPSRACPRTPTWRTSASSSPRAPFGRRAWSRFGPRAGRDGSRSTCPRGSPPAGRRSGRSSERN